MSFTNASAVPLAEVYLRLWDNAHGSCPSTPVTVTGGTADPLSVGCTALRVALPAPLAQNRSATIGFDLRLVVTAGVDRFGHDGAYYFIGNALPVLAVRDAKGWHLDPYTNNGESFYSLVSDFDVRLDHPSGMSVPATGTSADTPGRPGVLRAGPLVRRVDRRGVQGGRAGGGRSHRPDRVLDAAPRHRLTAPTGRRLCDDEP